MTSFCSGFWNHYQLRHSNITQGCRYISQAVQICRVLWHHKSEAISSLHHLYLHPTSHQAPLFCTSEVGRINLWIQWPPTKRRTQRRREVEWGQLCDPTPLNTAGKTWLKGKLWFCISVEFCLKHIGHFKDSEICDLVQKGFTLKVI